MDFRKAAKGRMQTSVKKDADGPYYQVDVDGSGAALPPVPDAGEAPPGPGYDPTGYDDDPGLDWRLDQGEEVDPELLDEQGGGEGESDVLTPDARAAIQWLMQKRAGGVR